MSEAMSAVVTALIMALASVVCQVLINHANRKKRVAEDAEKEKEKAVVEARNAEQLKNRLGSIEAKLDEHNGYAKLFQQIQTDIAVIKNDIKNIYKSKG